MFVSSSRTGSLSREFVRPPNISVRENGAHVFDGSRITMEGHVFHDVTNEKNVSQKTMILK